MLDNSLPLTLNFVTQMKRKLNFENNFDDFSKVSLPNLHEKD